MLTENTLTRRRWPLVAAAAAVVALAIGAIALVNRDDGAQQPADVPEPTPTVAPAPEPETGADEQQGAAGDVSPLPAEGEALPPGRYAPFTLGVPVTFEVPESATGWTVQVNDDIAVTIGPEGSFVNMSRLGSLYDAAQSEDPDFTGLGGIPPDDVDAWIAANGVIVDDSREVTVDGRSAKLRQVRAPEGAGQQTCPPEIQPCVRVSSASADLQDTWDLPSVAAYGPLPHTLVIVELDDFEPLGIWVHTDTGEPQSWLAEVQPLIDSIELGDPAPATEFGQARLSTFDTGDGELPEAGEQVAPGTYGTDAIGTPVTVDIQDGQTGPWTLVSNDQNGIQLISDDTGREFIAVGRVGSWFDAEEARTEATRGLGSIPADGMDTWIAANDVIVVDSAEVQVGRRDASYRLIRLDTTPGATADFCPPGEAPCLWAASGSADLVDAESTPVPFGRDRLQVLWAVDMGEFEPVFIFAAANLDDDGPWFTDTVQPIVDSIVFGEPAPVIPGGTARIPERQQFFASYAGTRTVGPVLEDGTREVIGQNIVEGDLTGELVATGVQITPTNGTDDLVFTGTIDGIGDGTLTMKQQWTASNNDIATRTFVVNGTGDFDGITGRVFTSVDVPDESGPEPIYSGRMTFELAVPEG